MGAPPEPYRAPRWLAGPHLQTIVPALFCRLPLPHYRRERLATPDGDFIDLDWIDAARVDVPLLILFHGLEGSSASHYARALMRAAQALGWRGVVPHFRGCSGELNSAPRFYHSGDSAEIDWIIDAVRARHPSACCYAVGISLGGNALLRWLGERGDAAGRRVAAAAAISAPVDLAAGGAALSRGFNRVYTQTFLKTLKPKCEKKLVQFPGLFDGAAMRRARDLYEFDNAVTAPLHGFKDTDDYWSRASSRGILTEIRVPTLILNAANDPFLPAAALPTAREVSGAVRLEQPAEGGHVGFHAARQGERWLAGRTTHFLRTGD